MQDNRRYRLVKIPPRHDKRKSKPLIFNEKRWKKYEIIHRGRKGTYIKEHSIAVGISIIPINAIKSLRKLNITN